MTHARRPFAVAGVYLALLGGLRLREVIALPADAAPGPDYPWWLLVYLQALVVVILLTGVGFLLAAGKKSRVLGVISGSAFLCITIVHAWFVAFHERAFADGGLVFGALHLLTLTRMDTTATSAGVAGYRVGQAIGILIWLGSAVYLLALGRKATVEQR